MTTVLLHLQHSFEMLLKAALVHKHVRVFDPSLGRSIGFGKCLNLGREHLALGEHEVGTLRAIDALRDEEQHWHVAPSEGILYVYARAGVTLFDEVLQRCFQERLETYLPSRVLPLSSDPPRDIQLLIDEECSQIRQLLAPHRRRRADARAHVRCLLALEAHVTGEVSVSMHDIERVERGVRAGKSRGQAFPRLAELDSQVSGTGLAVAVRFSKVTGLPVTFVPDGNAGDVAAVREVDLQSKFHWSKPELARKLGLSLPRCYALRVVLGIEDENDCRHDFVFGSSVHRQYSDTALVRMRRALETIDMDQVWQDYRGQ
ncbi:MAG: hypothetical protein ACRENX_01640 [Candidatus Dormibacteria bacterium]